MKSTFTALLIIFVLFSSFNYAQVYVASDGNDTNTGTISAPLKTIPAAVTKAQPGDTIYVRGGTYSLTSTITISKSGTESARYYLFAYPGERPLFDFSKQSSGSRGLSLRASYWHIKGIDIKGCGDNGMELNGGAYNIVEFCSFFENRDSGMQLSNGAHDNRILNCDSYYNADPDNYGDADGFAPKLTVGTGNYFYGCRAWNNVDDGWDGYMREADNATTILENCWTFRNGWLKNGSDPGAQANGNGFKMGGSDDKTRKHDFTLTNCLAFDNKVKGFDQNNNKGSMILYNCTGYRNGGNNFSISASLNTGKTAVVKNSVALGGKVSLATFVVQQTNGWMSPFTTSNEDFISIDTAGVTAPRKSDGSLPDITFMHLAAGSDLINGGTDLGLPYSGSAPDLGAFEYSPTVPVELASFTASLAGSNVTLSWSTATETNNLGFDIQKSSDNRSFYTIGFVSGAGSASETRQYTFTDKNISKGIYYYRLRQVDFNGVFKYSDEVMINNNIPGEFSLEQNYPNPFNPVTKISFSIKERGSVSLFVYNMLGEVVSVPVDNKTMEAGIYSINFNAEKLTSGMYIYTLVQGNNTLSKKMIVMK